MRRGLKLQEEWAFNIMKIKRTKTTRGGKTGCQAEDCYTVKYNTHKKKDKKKDNGSAQDYRHQEAK